MHIFSIFMHTLPSPDEMIEGIGLCLLYLSANLHLSCNCQAIDITLTYLIYNVPCIKQITLTLTTWWPWLWSCDPRWHIQGHSVSQTGLVKKNAWMFSARVTEIHFTNVPIFILLAFICMITQILPYLSYQHSFHFWYFLPMLFLYIISYRMYLVANCRSASIFFWNGSWKKKQHSFLFSSFIGQTHLLSPWVIWAQLKIGHARAVLLMHQGQRNKEKKVSPNLNDHQINLIMDLEIMSSHTNY